MKNSEQSAIIGRNYNLSSASWTGWKSQECSASCGESLRRYTRLCVGAGRCIGDDTKFEPCVDLPECGKNRKSGFTHSNTKI